MDIHGQIKRRLLETHRQRSRFAYFPILIIIFVSSYLQREELTKLNHWWHPIAIVTLSLLFRFINLEIFSNSWLHGKAWSKTINFFTMILGGAGWGYHFCNIFEAYGSGSPHVTYALLVVAGMIAGATTSLTASRSSYFTYVTSITILAAYPYVQTFSQNGQYALFNIFVFYIYNVSNYLTAHKELVRMVSIELQSDFEKNRFRRLIDAVPGYVAFINKNLIYVDANSATLSLFPKVIGKKVGFENPENLAFVENFQRSTKEREVTERTVTIHGLESYYLVSMQKTEDEGIVIITLSMDELVKARKELRAQEAKAQYSAKLASLGEMAAGIAHEVNNPLTIIQGSSMVINRLIDESPPDYANIKILTGRMSVTAERIAKIIKSLKSLSRTGDSDPMTTINIAEIINQCMDICRQRFNNFDITLVLPDLKQVEHLTINGREVQISQVLVNLLSNASDAVRSLPERRVEIAFNIHSDWLDILIKDSGPGVPPEIQAKIMDPFFTTKEVNQGTGLGLSISKAIMLEHKGELNYLTEEKVSTFRMRLPIVKPT